MLRRSAGATSVRGMARTRDFEQQAAATRPTWWPRPRDRGRERERGQRCPVQWRCCWRCLWPAGGRSRQRLVGRVRSATPKGESPMLRAARWCLPRRVGAGQECEHLQLLLVPMLGVPSAGHRPDPRNPAGAASSGNADSPGAKATNAESSTGDIADNSLKSGGLLRGPAPGELVHRAVLWRPTPCHRVSRRLRHAWWTTLVDRLLAECTYSKRNECSLQGVSRGASCGKGLPLYYLVRRGGTRGRRVRGDAGRLIRAGAASGRSA